MSKLKTILAATLYILALIIAIATKQKNEKLTHTLIPIYWFCVMAYWAGGIV